MQNFFGWLRNWNADRPPTRRAAVRGLDIYSLGTSIEAVLGHLDAADPAAAHAARQRYGCLSTWHHAPEEYGHADMMEAQDPAGRRPWRNSDTCWTSA